MSSDWQGFPACWNDPQWLEQRQHEVADGFRAGRWDGRPLQTRHAQTELRLIEQRLDELEHA